jgi:inner membrane protein
MHRTGHYGAALIGYAPAGAVALAFGLSQFALIGGGLAVGLAMLPDWDQKVPFVDHRGVTHTVHFAVLVGGLLAVAGALIGTSAGLASAALLSIFGFAVGFGTIISHIAADALTPMGVEPFRNGRRYSFDLAKASNPIANYLLLGLGIAAVAIAGALGTAVA